MQDTQCQLWTYAKWYSINPGHLWDSYEGEYYPVQNGTLFLPHPTDTGLYYLLHKGTSIVKVGIGGYYLPDVLYYSTIDPSVGCWLGASTKKRGVNVRLLNESQMVACRHANGRNWWILSVTQVRTSIIFTAGSFRYSQKQRIGPNGPGTKKCTMAMPASARREIVMFFFRLRKDQLLLMDFDRCNGSSPIRFNWLLRDSLRPPSCCFSPNGRFLYFNDILNLWQFDLQSSKNSS